MTNFYSEDILNDILDHADIENILPKMEEIYQAIYRLFCNYTHNVICPNYILTLLADQTNKIAFRCIDMEFNIENCPSILIYHRHYNKESKELIYYILMICTKPKFKKFGYASKLLDDFIQNIKNKHAQQSEIQTPYNKIKIILSSVETAVTFYEIYGFKWTRALLTNHRTLMRYEKYDKDKEYFILELDIT
jgi:GNAT superfamily N-acetyltransferase